MNTIFFGAGKIGHKFASSKYLNNLKSTSDRLFFYDNNKKLPKVIEGISRIDTLDAMSNDSEVIITCGDYVQVYRQCIRNGFKDIRIYDEKKDIVSSIWDYCLGNPGYFENAECAKYQNEKYDVVSMNKKKFIQTNDLFGSITEVAIMLSNLCNYAALHKKCPASCVKEKQIMPSKTVYKILDELASSNFDGTICFHIYNEPLVDPRLFMFIQYAKNVMPDSKIRIYSNGYYLDRTMAEELREIGTDILVTTGYGKAEYERLMNLNSGIKMGFSVLLGNLDDRMDYYTKKNTTHVVSNDLCDTYIYQIPIYADGDIGTCCLDYKHPYGLGNIMECSLEKCLNSKMVVEFQQKLLSGDRTMFPICTNCFWKR